MSGFALVSYILLWILFIALSLLCLGMLQQIGLLQKRLQTQDMNASAGENASDISVPDIPAIEADGPAIGALLPDKILSPSNGYDAISLRNSGKRGTLLVSLSATCESCQLLVDPLNAFVDAGLYDGQMITLLREDEAGCRAFLSVFPIHMPVVCHDARALMIDLQVHRNPFGLLYDEQGFLVRKGILKGHDDLLALLGDSSVPRSSLVNVFPSPAASAIGS